MVTSEISAAREAPKIFEKQKGFHHLPDTLGMASMHEETPARGQGGPQKVVQCCKLEGFVVRRCLKFRFWSHLLLLQGLAGSRRSPPMTSQEAGERLGGAPPRVWEPGLGQKFRRNLAPNPSRALELNT